MGSDDFFFFIYSSPLSGQIRIVGMPVTQQLAMNDVDMHQSGIVPQVLHLLFVTPLRQFCYVVLTIFREFPPKA